MILEAYLLFSAYVAYILNITLCQPSSSFTDPSIARFYPRQRPTVGYIYIEQKSLPSSFKIGCHQLIFQQSIQQDLATLLIMFSLTSAVLTLASIGHVLGGIVSRTPEDSVLQQYNITGVDGSPYAVNM